MNKIQFAVILFIVATASLVVGSQWNNWFARSLFPVAATGKKDVLPLDYQSPVPKISTSAAKGHRDSHYEDMRSIDNVLELPTDFAQAEALYTIAGRANAAELEQYIREALLIVDRYDRLGALEILFSRYVELEPNAAVDFLLKMDRDVGGQIINGVFQEWARIDPNGAIVAANSIVDVSKRKKAGEGVLIATARFAPDILDAVALQLVDRHKLEYLESEAVAIRAIHDPETALADALVIKNGEGRLDALRRVGAVWARDDPAAAIGFAQGIDELKARQEFMSSVFARWMEDDPEAAMQSILATPTPQERDWYLAVGLGNYARSNPKEALLMASQLSGRMKTSAYRNIYSTWFSHDPDAVIQEFAVMDDSPDREALLEVVMSDVAQDDPDTALLWANAMDASERSSHLPGILANLAQSDPRRALEIAIAESPDDSLSALSLVLASVGYNDPGLALEYVSQLPAGSERDKHYVEITKNLARRDPQAALAWVSTMSGQAYVTAVSGIAGVVAQSDPERAATIVGQVPDAARGELIQAIGRAISYDDPQLALDWLGRFRNSPEYDPTAAQIAGSIAYRDPQHALRIAKGLGNEYQREAMENVLRIWARSDPAAALRWVTSSDASEYTQVISNAVHELAFRDPVSVSGLVKSMRPGEAKDHALGALAWSGEFDTPETTKLLNAIESEAQRDQAIFIAYVILSRERNNIDGANELLDSVDASDNLRQLLRPDGE